MWGKPANFDQLSEVYWTEKRRSNSVIDGIKAIRSFCPMSLVEAKNAMIWIEQNRSIYDYQQELAEMIEAEDLDVQEVE